MIFEMKKIYFIIAAIVLLAVSSCHQPEWVEPTVQRQGITGLTAYFTFGPNTEKVLGQLAVPEGESPDRYVIPIPWFYPEESEEETTLHMTRARVRASLAPDCSIDPPLTVLDLNLENRFTYTNAQGESKSIVITGERTKSATTNMLSMNLRNPETGEVVLEGFIDNETKTVYMFTVEDISGLIADVTPWYHASVKDAEEIMKEDESGYPVETGVFLLKEVKDWNQDQTVTVIAHDGKTEGEFVVIKKNPEKIPYGVNQVSFKELFNIDPLTRLGVPPYTQAGVLSTIASIQGYLIVNHGDGKAPMYLDGRNGSKLGDVNVGGLSVGAVTNDEAGNLIMCNRLEAAGTFEIYRTASVTEAPTLFYKYESEVSLPLGAKIKVIGNIDADACIVVNYEGVDGITSASQILNIVVKGGQVASADVVDFAGIGLSWGSSPTYYSGIVPTTVDSSNGWFYASYSLNGFQWVKPSMSLGSPVLTNDMDRAWLVNPSCLDAKRFNNATFMCLLVLHHFPAWELQPSLWLYDITDPSTVSGNYNAGDNPSLVAYNSWITYNNASNAEGTVSSGDVVMAASEDGFKLYVYYYDHYAGTIGGYSADCVKK